MSNFRDPYLAMRLEDLERRAVGDRVPGRLERAAEKACDPVVAQWLRDHMNPVRLRRELANIRMCLDSGDEEGARARLYRFEMNIHHADGLATKLQRAEAGRSKTRQAWAVGLAERLVREGIKSPADAKARLPRDYTRAFVVDEDHAVYLLIEKDEELVVCIDQVSTDYREIGIPLK